MKVLVVKGDKNARERLTTVLESELFVVDAVEKCEEGSFLAKTNDYDIVILDCTLPLKTGLCVCKELRLHGRDMPILILSEGCEIENKTEILDAGADDCLTKPYSYKELLSRMRALLRRSSPKRTTSYSVGNLLLDCGTQEAYVDRKSIYLTTKEFLLLEVLLRNKGRVVSRGMIMEHVWSTEGNPFSKTIETHILNLRRKVEKNRRKIIQSVPGRGYKISD
ncbi:MAG: response regulator transcription factor [Candidatus Paceibacterota bacterium]|jgi:DNA-binding response OmpR family regulator